MFININIFDDTTRCMKLNPEKIKALDEKKPLDLFTQSTKSDRTRYVYKCKLQQILCEYMEDVLSGTYKERVAQLLDLGRKKPAWTCGLMVELASILRERTTLGKDDPRYLSPTSINANFAPLKKLFVVNDVALPWNRIRATFPEMETYETRGWTRDDIRRMLRHARGAVDRAIILVMASSGVRIGGMELKWGHIVPIYDEGSRLREGNSMLEEEDSSKPVACAMLRVYAGTFAEYAAFITPEAYEAVQDYRAVWAREAGREPKPGDWFIKKAGPSTAGLTHDGIKQRVYKAIWNAGLRGSETKEGARHNVPGMNGFRRFCNKALKDAKSDDSTLASMIKKERMLGHAGLLKMDRNYRKTNMLEIAEEYLGAVPNLTIHGTGRGGTAGADGTRPAPVAGVRDADAPDAKPPVDGNAGGTRLTSESPCPNCGRECSEHTEDEFKMCRDQFKETHPSQPGT